MLVSVTGADRKGIIADLSKAIYEGGASITTSKMMSLGADFTIVMHVECPPKNLFATRDALTRNLKSDAGLQATIHDVTPLSETSTRPVFTGQVSLTGVDRPGLLYKLSDLLTGKGLSIEHLQTEQHRVRAGAPMVFTTHCHVCGSEKPDIAALRGALKALEKELDVVCSLEIFEGNKGLLHRSVTG